MGYEELSNSQLDEAHTQTEAEIEAAKERLLFIQDERYRRWYMQHVMMELPKNTVAE